MKKKILTQVTILAAFLLAPALVVAQGEGKHNYR